MCVPPRDLIGDRIKAHGRWHDCAALVRMWEKVPHAGEIFVEVGANIGACTLEVLYHTCASAVVFEPNPLALAYLTRSLNAVDRMQHRPDHRKQCRQHGSRLPTGHCIPIAGRVAVLPFALGSSVDTAYLASSVEADNLGDSEISPSHARAGAALDNAAHARDPRRRVAVMPLDACIAMSKRSRESSNTSKGRAHPPVRLLKLDAQGSECQVLDGAKALLRERAIGAIQSEVDWLRLVKQGCSEAGLVQRLSHRAAGFAIDTSMTLASELADGSIRLQKSGRPQISKHKLKLRVHKH